jgi:uncharacterized protein
MSQDFARIAAQMSRDVYLNLRQSVELGRWPDGRKLTAEQRATSLQAIIAWEALHLPEHERAGYIDKPECASHEHEEQPVNWRSGDKHNA